VEGRKEKFKMNNLSQTWANNKTLVKKD